DRLDKPPRINLGHLLKTNNEIMQMHIAPIFDNGPQDYAAQFLGLKFEDILRIRYTAGKSVRHDRLLLL
ncbi:hypothetical protein, partial [Enterococcus faecalis]|uniref:hypothetical protein n=1 Tax=Enterococcus faecalis TaxID=1351 RepID=UPI00403F72A2